MKILMKKFKNRNIKRTAAYILLAALLLSGPLSSLSANAITRADKGSAAENEDAIHISTVEDLISFGNSCTLDTWSRDKIFILDNDIDLNGKDFKPVPTFGGVFFGQGHVIKGLSLTGGSNHVGLFRYIQESGEVYQLSVSGTAVSQDSQIGLGLLAGCNSGLISGCSSSGNVTGNEQVGSIAGTNELTGVITGCFTNGVVYGSHLAGGIAGENKGSITNCSNHCFINTTATDGSLDLSSLNVDTAFMDILTTENAASVTDIGGIAGCNYGVIRACTNEGSVGYQHVGYNIGGIAGSQTGYIEGCINYGLLNGRKDVGGIAGQMEPSGELEFSEDTLAKLNTELETLHQLLSKLDKDASGASGNLTGQIDQLLTSVENSQNAVHQIMDNASGHLQDFSIGTDLTSLPTPKPISLDFLPTPKPSASGTPSPEGTAAPLTTGTPTATPTVTPTATPTPTPTATPTPTPTATPTSDSPDKTNQDLPNQEGIETSETEIVTSRTAYAAPPALTGSLLHSSAMGNTEDTNVPAPVADPTPTPAATPTPTPTFGWPEGWPTPSIEINTDDLLDHIPSIDTDEAEKEINRVQSNIYEDASKTLNELQNRVKNQASVMGSRIASARSMLSSSFSAIIGDMRFLNSMMDGESQLLLDDFQAINDQINVIGNLLTAPETTAPGDILTDVSDDDQPEDITGKVMNCANSGKINGDLNVGGIAGSLSRENNLDPEDDLDLDESDITLKFRYKERIVVRSCTNSGNVAGKRDCVGGIAGEMTLGSIMECISTGVITGEGAMIGGIAGNSTSTIRKSSAKCTLKGEHQIGGIAGYGTNITDCYSMVQINEGQYYLGSIAGNISKDGELSSNYFVEGCPAGIDGVSYEGKAQPLSYEEFLASPGLPDIFQKIYLTFTADDKIVSVIGLEYGESLSPASLPQVPEKEGCIGTWPDFNHNSITYDQTIAAVYSEYVTTLASSQKEGNRPVILIEGNFRPDDVFTLSPADACPEDSMTQARCWKITLPSAATDIYTIRYLIPAEMEDSGIEIFDNGSFREIDTETDGSYYVFTARGPSITFRCVKRPGAPAAGIVTLTVTCAGAAVVILLTGKSLQKKKGKKS